MYQPARSQNIPLAAFARVDRPRGPAHARISARTRIRVGTSSAAARQRRRNKGFHAQIRRICMPSGWEATGEVRWSSRWAASTRCVNLLLAKNPPCRSAFGRTARRYPARTRLARSRAGTRRSRRAQPRRASTARARVCGRQIARHRARASVAAADAAARTTGALPRRATAATACCGVGLPLFAALAAVLSQDRPQLRSRLPARRRAASRARSWCRRRAPGSRRSRTLIFSQVARANTNGSRSVLIRAVQQVRWAQLGSAGRSDLPI